MCIFLEEQALAAGSGVQINDLDESFADGRAFCAIMYVVRVLVLVARAKTRIFVSHTYIFHSPLFLPTPHSREALSPNSIDVAGLSTEDRRGNFELAFGISESKLDQIPLLDVEVNEKKKKHIIFFFSFFFYRRV